MRMTKAFAAAAGLALVLAACSQSPKELVTFAFPASLNSPLLDSDCTGVISGDAVAVEVPFLADREPLVAVFTTTGSQVLVGSTPQQSGVTENDFTEPVTYTVVSEDGSRQDFVVDVTGRWTDTFERADGPTVGNGWTELPFGDPPATDAAIVSGALVLKGGNYSSWPFGGVQRGGTEFSGPFSISVRFTRDPQSVVIIQLLNAASQSTYRFVFNETSSLAVFGLSGPLASTNPPGYDESHPHTLTGSVDGSTLKLQLRDEITGTVDTLTCSDSSYSSFKYIALYGGHWIDPVQYEAAIDEVTFVSD